MTEIIILAASPGKRMKSSVSKSMLLLKKETLVERQLRLLAQRFPESTVKLIIGFKADKLRKHIQSITTNLHIICCKNTNYESISAAQAIATYRDSRKNALIVSGDLVFSQGLLNVNFDDSGIITVKKYMENSEMGFSDIDGYAGYFSYSFNNKYGQIAYLTKRDMDLFCTIASQRQNKNLLNSEVFNKMIDEGTYFKIYRPKNGTILDVDKMADLGRAAKIV